MFDENSHPMLAVFAYPFYLLPNMNTKVLF